MENLRFIKIFTYVMAGGTLLVLPFFTFAYDDKTTHPALTQEIVKLFNLRFQELKISDTDAEYVIQGSIDEDLETRWMRHFYDPVYNRGLTILGQEWMNSKEWSQNTLAQAGFPESYTAGTLTSYFSGDDDFSWERAIYEYAWGDKKRGLNSLGHVLHLIEDASVPDHTRNDPHPPAFSWGSPYEGWATKFTRQSFSFGGDEKPLVLSVLNLYFHSLAKYSNNNFFSKDTIFNNEYDKPVVDYYLGEFGYGNPSYPLVRKVKKLGGGIEYSLTDEQDKILTSYWSRLSKQAVLHGAGVVKLFFDEVAKEKQTKTLYEKNRSWIQKELDKFRASIFNLAGVIYGTSVTLEDLEENTSPPVPDLVSNETETKSGTAEVQPPIPTEIVALNLQSTQTPVPDLVLSPPKTNSGTAPPPSSNTSADLPFAGVGSAPPKSQEVEPPTGGSTSSDEPPAETPLEEPEPEDTTPPDIMLKCGPSLSQDTDSCLFATTTAILEWSSAAEDLDYYELTYNETTSTTTSTSTAIFIAENSSQSFSVRAKDKTGNWSAPESVTIENIARPVIINEVAWAGTSAARDQDEWLELKNITGKDIDLNGWILRSQTDNTPYIQLIGAIPANGFFLLERTDNNTVSDIGANQIYTGSLVNGGEVLELSHASTTIDRTPEISACPGRWCGGEAGPSYYWTMERYDPYSSGEDKNNWGSWAGFLNNGKNADNLPIKGTPKKRNSINYLIDKSAMTLHQDKTLNELNSPYLVADSLAIPNGKTLIINPGVIIKFMNGTSMTVNGTLKSEGTTEYPIIFTSFKDDSYEGDTNQDATTTIPLPGDWATIKILADGSSFDNAVFRYGGLDDFSGQAWANLRIENSSVTVKNSIIEKSKTYGIWLKNSSGTIENNLIKNNARNDPGQTPGIGLVVSGGNPVISKNQFAQNNLGLLVNQYSTAQISENSFTQNVGFAIHSNGAYASFSGNTASDNGANGILLQGSLAQNYTLAPNLPYVIPNTYAVNGGLTLTINPGTIIKFDGGGIQVSGALRAEGTENEKIVFTSFKDDGYGGDTNGTTTPASDGDWKNINFTATSRDSIINHAVIRYGGPKAPFSTERGAIRLKDSFLEIKNVLIEKNYLAGIWMENSTSTVISDSIIKDHQKPDTPTPNEPSYGIYLLNSSTTIQSTLFKNNKIHIFTDGTSGYIDGGDNIFE